MNDIPEIRVPPKAPPPRITKIEVPDGVVSNPFPSTVAIGQKELQPIDIVIRLAAFFSIGFMLGSSLFSVAGIGLAVGVLTLCSWTRHKVEIVGCGVSIFIALLALAFPYLENLQRQRHEENVRRLMREGGHTKTLAEQSEEFDRKQAESEKRTDELLRSLRQQKEGF